MSELDQREGRKEGRKETVQALLPGECITFANGEWSTPAGRLPQNALDGDFSDELKAFVAHKGQGLARQVEALVQDLVAILRQAWVVTSQGLLSWKETHLVNCWGVTCWAWSRSPIRRQGQALTIPAVSKADSRGHS